MLQERIFQHSSHWFFYHFGSSGHKNRLFNKRFTILYSLTFYVLGEIIKMNVLIFRNIRPLMFEREEIHREK